MDSRAHKILARLSRTPEFQVAEAQEAEAEVTARKALAAERVTVEADHTKSIGAALKALETETSKLEKAQQALTAAQMGWSQAKITVSNFDARKDAALDRINAELREGAIPGIRLFLDSIYGVWEHERMRWEWLAPTDRKGVPMSGHERIEQIKAIREQAEALYFEADPEVAESELQRLKSEIQLPTAAAA